MSMAQKKSVAQFGPVGGRKTDPSGAEHALRSRIVIPARLASTRLPRKLLLCETGKPLIQHTYEAAQQSQRAGWVCVAADCEEIAAVVRGFGGEALLTSPDCASGTDRIAEVAQQLSDVDIFVNVQGDEPELSGQAIDLVVALLERHPAVNMATLATPIRSQEKLYDPACVKVVMAELREQGAGDRGELEGRKQKAESRRQKGGGRREEEESASGHSPFLIPHSPIDSKSPPAAYRVLPTAYRALYFSRAAIPHAREWRNELLSAQPPHFFQHLGLYAYRRDFLLQLARWPRTLLERLENLEQLRVLEHGEDILVGLVDEPTIGIDTPADYAAFVQRFRAQSESRR
ncbi:MAG TPA: 3-deoxy-manno-octulosonate cytidylyltransferase [Pirellulales bacterium]|nr:3-deoxy-manno-octulosonate cytidylyltransferase [Pirellulales bacterium]